MKITFEIDTKDEDADEYLKLISKKATAYVGANDLCELYCTIYNRKIYGDNIIKYEKIQDPRHPDDPTKTITKEWIDLDYIEKELEKIFDNLKEFQYLD